MHITKNTSYSFTKIYDNTKYLNIGQYDTIRVQRDLYLSSDSQSDRQDNNTTNYFYYNDHLLLLLPTLSALVQKYTTIRNATMYGNTTP